MPRHVHKPSKDKSTKSILETMHDAQKATMAIKADLLEHNQAIHLHMTKEGKPQNAQEETESSDKFANSAADRSGSDSFKRQGAGSSSETARSGKNEDSDQASEATKNTSEAQSFYGSSASGSKKESGAQSPFGSARSKSADEAQGEAPVSEQGSYLYGQAVNMMQQNMQQWLEAQARLSHMMLGGWMSFFQQDKK